MQPRNNYKLTVGRQDKAQRFALLLLLIAGSIVAVSTKHPVAGSPHKGADRYYLRVSGCDDGGRAYLNNHLMVDVGFDEDSNWLDITEDVAQGKAEIRFEVINKTGAITYVFQVKRNETIVFEQACGKAKEIGCEDNRAFRVGKARKFTYTIRRDE